VIDFRRDNRASTAVLTSEIDLHWQTIRVVVNECKLYRSIHIDRIVLVVFRMLLTSFECAVDIFSPCRMCSSDRALTLDTYSKQYEKYLRARVGRTLIKLGTNSALSGSK